MGSRLWQEWSGQWPLPVVAICLVAILAGLRLILPVIEGGRIRAGIFFGGTYLISLFAIGLLAPEGSLTPHHHYWLRVLSTLLFSFAAVITSGLLLFDLALAKREVPRILRDLVHGIAYLITAALVLTRSDVDVTKVFTASVLTTAVIGLALQETLGNIMAGLALQLERDFDVGDWIRLDDKLSGRIREVRWRATTLVTKNGDLMMVPNSVVARAVLTNFSRPTTAHRQWVHFRAHFRHPPATVRDIVVEALRSLPSIRQDPPPDCVLSEFRDDAVNYSCRYWIDDFQRDDSLDSEVRSIIWYALHRRGMELPYPSLNVNMTEMNEDRLQRKLDEDYARRVDALSRVDVFRALDAQKIDRLARRLRRAIFGPSEVVLRQGDPGDSLYVVQSGQVAVRIDVHGHQREVATLSAGQFFGEMSLMTGESRAATVVAKSDVECYIVDKEAFQEILETQPDLAGIISDILSQRQVTLGASSQVGPGTGAVQKNQLRSRIAAFFGIGIKGKP
ncbi:MAG TPA: mechanosensitive ion channel family protein [Polyangia bacterium]|nr:mechanosensitive ion channel family protein [Polyangia bacterium]